jgi:predicted DNA-binding transcriptional regulator AlpA
MSTRQKNEKYLSIGDVAVRYGVTRRTVDRWTKKDRDFPRSVLISNRKYFSEYDLEKWESNRGGRDPDLEGRFVGLKATSGVITDYRAFVDAMITRRNALKITSIELDALSGMQEGYASKLENWGRMQGRGIGPEIFPLWLGALRVGIVLVDLPRRPRKTKENGSVKKIAN